MPVFKLKYSFHVLFTFLDYDEDLINLGHSWDAVLLLSPISSKQVMFYTSKDSLLNARKCKEINYVFFQLGLLSFQFYLPAVIKGVHLKRTGWVEYLFHALLCPEHLKQCCMLRSTG